MMKHVRKGMALLMAIVMMNVMAQPVAAQTFTSAVNGLRLREAAGLNGRVIAYLGLGDQMDCYWTTGVIDNQLWRYGRMTTRDVTGLTGYASAAFMR